MTVAVRPFVLSGSKRREWEKSVLGDPRLTKSTDVFLATVILSYCQGKAECWPTLETLCKQMRSTKRTIQSAIKRCVNAGVLVLKDDPSKRSGRTFVFTDHPSLKPVEGQAKCAEEPRKSCATPSQKLAPKSELNQNYSSSSSLCSEESSSKSAPETPRTTTTDLPEALVQEISRTLPERDAKAILGAGRVIAKKALGKWDLVSKAIVYVKRQRDSINGVVPYLVTVVDSWATGGIPEHILPLCVIREPEPERRIAASPPGKWDAIYRKQREQSELAAMQKPRRNSRLGLA